MNQQHEGAKRQIRRLFVANRGEIAVRVAQACRTLGIEVVAGVSEADQNSLAARMADSMTVIGAAPAAESYLNIEKVISAAKRSGCDALHPGYGFLAERPALARACAEAGILFIGPTPEAIEQMGDKITAVKLAEAAGVPRVPGSDAVKDASEAAGVAQAIGYPVLLKATAGGGGRGMRVVREEAELAVAMESASNEAQAAFGDGTVYLEKFIEQARHIEIQVMGDRLGNVVHLGERECSTQRRHQKLIEEAPSPAINAGLRAEMGRCAVQLARNVNYVGAGTVEFVLDEAEGHFYFLEMNTRIQVEHPVTEMVTGIDLVAEQIRVTQGLPLSFKQEDIQLRGHAIECRINAEDFNKNFLPKPGLITAWNPPEGNGIRLDSHCYAGYSVPPYYDSLLAKLIVHGATRAEAIEHMLQALKNFGIEGIPSTIPFHQEVLREPAFIEGAVTTRWVEQTFLPERKARLRAAADAAKATAVAAASTQEQAS
ncbi:acetyl-CoA carboxylase biotin carboxylase subunit [Parapusillimonas granuli]|uniref:Biotin carboxylase n=1 Tax=Parapusillimonas granuli TaxID=380911 RepID=A0A853FYL6_9BURK|nr:acetyl-CoA carboxylase biotin carboxylase subunit [Parapusillimonas granuli]NYT49169.1 acetyl-CoA carboxylase biotin carboxylase subunit [Parapusillimonas granuli]